MCPRAAGLHVIARRLALCVAGTEDAVLTAIDLFDDLFDTKLMLTRVAHASAERFKLCPCLYLRHPQASHGNTIHAWLETASPMYAGIASVP